MNTVRIFLGAAILAIGFFANLALADQTEQKQTEQKQVEQKPAEEGPKVAAKVNGKEILMSDVNLFVEPVLERAKAMGQQIPPETEGTIRKQWVEQMIARELFLQQAIAEKVVVPDEDIESALSEAQQHGVTIPTDALRKLIKDDLMINKTIEANIISKIVVPDKEVEDFYNSQKEVFKQPEQIEARHILIKVNPTDTQEVKDNALKKIKDILAEVKEGKKTFAELAKEHSECPSGPNGGDLGYFGRGQMVPGFENAAFALKTGEISDVVETQFGYHIIKVEDRKESRTIPLAEVKEDIKKNIEGQQGNQKIEEWLKELKSKATIEVLE